MDSELKSAIKFHSIHPSRFQYHYSLDNNQMIEHSKYIHNITLQFHWTHDSSLLLDLKKFLALSTAGATKEYTNFATGCVNVRDTALAHVLAYEMPSAEGRYILSKTVVHFEDIAKILKNICPGYPIPSKYAFLTLRVSHGRSKSCHLLYLQV